MKCRLTLLALALLLVPGAGAQQAQNPQARPFAWKVTTPTGTAFLLGSIHVARPDFYPLDPRIMEAYRSSPALVVEADVTRSQSDSLQTMMQKAVYPPGDGIERHISREVFDQVNARLAKYGLGLAALRQFKPWFVAQTIVMTELQQMGFSPQNGVDVQFLTNARGRKKILELESAGAQLDLFNGFSDREQELFLVYTLKDIDNTGKHVEEMIKAWKSGDADALEALITESVKDSPEMAAIYRKLIDERNVAMAKKIEGYLQTPETHFVVVGAAHLVGRNGLINLLKQANCSVEQF